MANKDAKDQQADSKQEGGKVKVKILRQVGPHQVGDEVELDEKLAEQLCEPSMQMHGGHLQNLQKAIRVSELEKAKDKKVDISNLTQVEMDQMGLKNRIPSPYDTHPSHEAVDIGKKADKIKAEYEKKTK